MQSLKQIADSGGFAISKPGAEAYVKAIQDAEDDLKKIDAHLHRIQEEVRLGTSPDAQAMAKYNLENAIGGPGTIGLVPAIDQLKTALREAKEAMQKAAENYDRVEQEIEQTHRSY
ncbi:MULTISPECIES: hypothetical protein [Actinosynnema]|uniref:PE domain-containing protein n=1 Tax=Actinosynnema pretiosum TaxID=42197 RepID=A0A290Z338_9PSEU|nr:hypothetical protein [Actinosynnema pretiosum]ATE53446.1 hypothetical protein CNX65_09175 [Actinosynnema pretiosum]